MPERHFNDISINKQWLTRGVLAFRMPSKDHQNAIHESSYQFSDGILKQKTSTLPQKTIKTPSLKPAPVVAYSDFVALWQIKTNLFTRYIFFIHRYRINAFESALILFLRQFSAILQTPKRQGLAKEHIEEATRIEMYAMRKLGDMLASTERAKGTAGTGNANVTGGTKMEPPVSEEKQPTLAELGIDKKTSSFSQKLAAIPEGWGAVEGNAKG